MLDILGVFQMFYHEYTFFFKSEEYGTLVLMRKREEVGDWGELTCSNTLWRIKPISVSHLPTELIFGSRIISNSGFFF